MRLFDTHAHLHDGRFASDANDVVARARAAGLLGLLTLGEDVASSQRDVELAEANPGFVYAAAGCHPHNADAMDGAAYAALRSLCEQDSVIAVGEIGLDFYRNLSSRDKQFEVFQWQLDLARELDKPVAIHCREAQAEMRPLIDAWASTVSAGHPLGVMHYFSGDVAEGAHYASLGFMISVHTSITYPKSDTLREVARALPLEALVVETDSPYGAPQSMRGKRNEPAQVLAAVEAIAGLRGDTVERVAEATTANALRLFRIDSRLTQPVAARRRGD
jgi:TatD DNase family protein